MSNYEYLVINYYADKVLGVFDDLDNALIFISGYCSTYFNEPNLKLVVVKQEKKG